jgi:hypothetical protein
MSDEVPPGVADVLGAAGPCPEVVHAGKAWKVGWPTQKAKAILERLVVAQATAETLALRDAVPPEAFAELWNGLRRAIGAREYRTFGPGWAAALASPGGSLLFPLALILQHHPDATADDVAALREHAGEAFALAVAEVVPPFLSMLGADPQAPPGSRARLAAAVLAATQTPDGPSA